MAEQNNKRLDILGFFVPALIGASIGGVRIPHILFPHLDERIDSGLVDVLFILPAIVTLLSLRKFILRSGPLSVIGFSTAIFFTLTSIANVIAAPDAKILTIIGSTSCLIMFVVGFGRFGGRITTAEFRIFLTAVCLAGSAFVVVLLTFGGASRAEIGVTQIQSDFLEVGGIHRNGATLVALISLCSALALILGARKIDILTTAVAGVSIVLAGYLIYAFPGKGAWLSGGIIMVATAFMAYLYKRRWMLIGFVAGGVVLIPVLFRRISDYLLVYGHEASSTTLSGRTILWDAANKGVFEHGRWPWGFGFDGAYSYSTNVIGGQLYHFHNELVNAFFCGGVIGVVLLSLWVITYLIYSYVLMMRARRDGDNRAIAAFGVFIGLLILSRLYSDVSLTALCEILPAFTLMAAILNYKVGDLMASAPRVTFQANTQRFRSRTGPAVASVRGVRQG